MSKKALIKKRMQEKQLKAAYGKDSGEFYVYVQQLLDGNQQLSDEQIFRQAVKHDSNMMNRLFGSKDGLKQMRNKLKKGGKAYGITFVGNKFSYDTDTLAKSIEKNGKFQLWANQDRNL